MLRCTDSGAVSLVGCGSGKGVLDCDEAPAKWLAAALTMFFASMYALKSDSFFALSCSLLTIAYATAAPAAAPRSVPMIVFAAPSPASDVVGVACGTAAGSETALATLGAFETTDAAFEATSVGAGLAVRELTTLLSSR
jgi:hypothetical protein